MESFAEVGPPRGTSQNNRCLGSHRTTKTNGDGTGNDARPTIVGLDAAPSSRHGVEYLCHAMTDVATYNILDKQHGDEDTDCGKDEIEEVGVFCRKARSEQMLDFSNQGFQHESGQACAYAHHEADHQHDLSFCMVTLNPFRDGMVQFDFLASEPDEIHALR